MADRITVGVRVFRDRPHLQLQWKDPQTGKRRTRSSGTADPQEARQRANDLAYELSHGLHAEPSRVTWEAFREAFTAEYLSGVRAGTRRVYYLAFADLERECSPGLVRGITARTLSALVAAQRARPLMASTIDVRLAKLKAALGWAVEQGFLPAVPAFPAVKVPQRRPQPVPAEAVERLLERCRDPYLHGLLLACWLAGLRLEEAVALRWDETETAPWVDLEGQRIRFPAAAVKADSDQWVPLDPELRAALLALGQTSGRVFWPDRPVTGNAVRQRVRWVARRAGVRLTCRSLRRGFVCRYASQVPAQVLRQLARHADIKTTLSYYASVDEAAMAAVLGPTPDRAAGPAPSSRERAAPDCEGG